MKADIVVDKVYDHPIERVWRALTSAEALAAWLMPNDFQPLVGHEFTFRTDPAPGFDGIVHCRVLELVEPTRMVWGWSGGPIDTTVTFTLTPHGSGPHGSGPRDSGPRGQATRLHMRQVGFAGLSGQFTRLVLASGSRRIYGRALPAYLDHLAGTAELHPIDCDKHWWKEIRWH